MSSADVTIQSKINTQPISTSRGWERLKIQECIFHIILQNTNQSTFNYRQSAAAPVFRQGLLFKVIEGAMLPEGKHVTRDS
jgi:hypothetical protein